MGLIQDPILNCSFGVYSPIRLLTDGDNPFHVSYCIASHMSSVLRQVGFETQSAYSQECGTSILNIIQCNCSYCIMETWELRHIADM